MKENVTFISGLPVRSQEALLEAACIATSKPDVCLSSLRSAKLAEKQSIPFLDRHAVARDDKNT